MPALRSYDKQHSLPGVEGLTAHRVGDVKIELRKARVIVTYNAFIDSAINLVLEELNVQICEAFLKDEDDIQFTFPSMPPMGGWNGDKVTEDIVDQVCEALNNLGYDFEQTHENDANTYTISW